MFVVTYIELKSGYNHPNLVDLYDPILDESECVSESSDALYNPLLDDSECACKSSKGGSYFIIHFWMILSKMWICWNVVTALLKVILLQENNQTTKEYITDAKHVD